MGQGEVVVSFRAGANISAAHQRVVKIDDDFQVNVTTNANAPEIPIGILQNDPNAAGQGASVLISGVSRAELGGTVTAGAALSMNNDGQLIAAPFEAAIGTADLLIFAFALEGGAVNNVIDVWVTGAPVPGSTE